MSKRAISLATGFGEFTSRCCGRFRLQAMRLVEEVGEVEAALVLLDPGQEFFLEFFAATLDFVALPDGVHVGGARDGPGQIENLNSAVGEICSSVFFYFAGNILDFADRDETSENPTKSLEKKIERFPMCVLEN